MNEITKERLYDLYVNQNKTDKEIGDLYGVTFGSVYIWRKKFGISGINARHRKLFDNPQVPITNRQMSIIIGTLLGDGCLKSQGKTAYLSIAHTINQKEYILWLYDELKSICPTFPKEFVSKGKYTTIYFASESRKDLNDIRNKIYTPSKSVSPWWANQIDDLALSIWFMDDGHLAYINKSKSEFSFATNSFSEKENYLLSSVLKDKFCINSTVRAISKKSGIQHNLFINEDSFDDFSDLIKPHIVNSMLYKLPSNEYKIHLRKNIEVKVDKEILEKLYHKDLLTHDQIARKLGIHKSTVRKYMNIFDICTRSNSESQLDGKNNFNERDMSGKFLPLDLDIKGDLIANELFKSIRLQGFPYPIVKDDDHYLGIIDNIFNNGINKQDEEGCFIYSRSGVGICSSLCPQVFSMSSNKSLTPLEIFNDDVLLMDCVRRTVKYAKKETIASVRQGLKTYKKNRCVTIFPPMWGKTALIKLCKRSELSVLDFSCGFGGRLLGSYASQKVIEYVGVDPLESNIKSHIKMSKLIKKHALLRNIDFTSSFHNNAAENILPQLDRKFDVIMTSPPYFSKERYGDSDSQCYVKYPEYEQWKDEWLTPILKSSYDLLDDGGTMIIFASDTMDHPVGTDCNAILNSVGHQKPIRLDFLQPTIEYLRKNKNKKIDTAWSIVKK